MTAKFKVGDIVGVSQLFGITAARIQEIVTAREDTLYRICFRDPKLHHYVRESELEFYFEEDEEESDDGDTEV